MASIDCTLPTPANFRLRTIVYSHGWYDLPPFQWSAEEASLRCVLWIGSVPATVVLRQTQPDSLAVQADRKGRWSAASKESLDQTLQMMLGLHLDFAEFYVLDRDRFGWAQELGAGAFLRGGTAFEDAVKMLATTNCSWALTRQMVTRLVDELGEPAPGGFRSFPTPEIMAQQDDDFYRTRVRAGYRAQAFRELAEKAAQGQVDLEAWARPAAGDVDDSTQLIRQVTQLRGFGRYAAENLCKLWGRFGHLGIDSWCLKKFVTLHGETPGSVEERIRQTYAPFGKWQGLALWLDLTKDWHEDRQDADIN